MRQMCGVEDHSLSFFLFNQDDFGADGLKYSDRPVLVLGGAGVGLWFCESGSEGAPHALPVAPFHLIAFDHSTLPVSKVWRSLELGWLLCIALVQEIVPNDLTPRAFGGQQRAMGNVKYASSFPVVCPRDKVDSLRTARSSDRFWMQARGFRR